MQYVGCCHSLTFLPAASNDNEDLLALATPSFDLDLIRRIKRSLREENAENGMLLSSRKERRFFQEVSDAERYIVLRYFTPNAPKQLVKELKRYILNTYLSPKVRPSRKKK